MLSETTRRELEAEMKALEAQKREAQEKIEAIHRFLLLMGGKPSMLGQSTNGSPSRFAGTGFRATLLSLLDPPGLTRKEIQRRLEEKGFRPNGKTPLRVLIYSDLYRLVQAKRVEERTGGRYVRKEVESG